MFFGNLLLTISIINKIFVIKMAKSALQTARASYKPKMPKALYGQVKIEEGKPTQSVADQEEVKKLFPNT